MPEPQSRRADIQLWLPVLFFISGIPALLYQLMWDRALFRIFGVNIESVTIVVTAFMLGLGLGSLAGGWLTRRRGLDLLALLAALELGIAAFGVGSLDAFDLVGRITAGWPLAGIAAASLGVLFLPTLLMGASLPVLVGYLAVRMGSVGRSFGHLYYANTLGAGVGCLLGIVAIFPFLGMRGSIAIAALMNCTVAAGALVARLRSPHGQRKILAGSPPQHGAADRSMRLGWALSLAFCGGFVALSYEVFFYRLVSFMTASNAAAFPLMLCAYLIGLAGGSREAGLLSADRDGGAARIVRGLATGALAAVALLPLLRMVSDVHPFAAVAMALIVVFITARSWGRLLPYLAERSIAPDEKAGRRVSYIYLANILGSASGSFVTGFVLTDWLDLTGLAVALGALALGVAFLVSRGTALPTDRRLIAFLFAALALGGFQHALTRDLLDAIQHQRHGRIVDVVENRSSIVTVDDQGRLYGNGLYDGQFNVALRGGVNKIERAYAIQLYRPNPRRVLVIGMSSGSWSQVIAALPSVQQMTIVEINPGYATLIAKYPSVASLLVNPKVERIVSDGRKWLIDHPDEKFDAVVANTSVHFRANASNVLSLEFMHLVRRHLDPGGVLFYNTTGSLRALRTGCTAFPYGARIDSFLAVGDSPFAMDAGIWRAALMGWRIDGEPVLDLSQAEDRTVLEDLTAMPEDRTDPAIEPSRKRVEDCSSILARSAGYEVITDDNMGTEWRWNLGFPP